MMQPAKPSSASYDALSAATWRGAALPEHRFTRDDFLAMLERGILRPEDRVELIEGKVVAMSPSGPKHAEYVDRLVAHFVNVHDQAQMRVQGSVALSQETVVDPDLVLLRRRPGGYADALPGPADVLLLIEVADASLTRDRQVKAQLYAEAGVVEYWIVDLVQESIVVHRDPRPSGYETINTYRQQASVSPTHLPEMALRPGDLFKLDDRA